MGVEALFQVVDAILGEASTQVMVVTQVVVATLVVVVIRVDLGDCICDL